MNQILKHVLIVNEEFRIFFLFLWYRHDLYYICKFNLCGRRRYTERKYTERENTEVDRDSISLAAFYRQYFLKELVSCPEFSLYQIIVIIALIQNL